MYNYDRVIIFYISNRRIVIIRVTTISGRHSSPVHAAATDRVRALITINIISIYMILYYYIVELAPVSVKNGERNSIIFKPSPSLVIIFFKFFPQLRSLAVRRLPCTTIININNTFTIYTPLHCPVPFRFFGFRFPAAFTHALMRHTYYYLFYASTLLPVCNIIIVTEP